MAESALNEDFRDLLIALSDELVFELEGRKIPYIGRAALLKNKLAAGRPKDLADAEWLKTHPDE